MPHDYDLSKRAFRSPSGKYVSRRETRVLIDKLSDFVRKQSGLIAKRFDNGEINASQFNVEMRELLKAGHIVASTVGRGGRSQMTVSDWGRVGRKIRWQYQYLDKFTRKLENGKLKIANTGYRAKQYVNAIYISYANSYSVAQQDFIDRGGDNNPQVEMLCRLVQNSQEGCVECSADAEDGWMPVSEMGEIGSRICQDFCLCEIIFEDELESR